jgi:hypothetical protein
MVMVMVMAVQCWFFVLFYKIAMVGLEIINEHMGWFMM